MELRTVFIRIVRGAFRPRRERVSMEFGVIPGQHLVENLGNFDRFLDAHIEFELQSGRITGVDPLSDFFLEVSGGIL